VHEARVTAERPPLPGSVHPNRVLVGLDLSPWVAGAINTPPHIHLADPAKAAFYTAGLASGSGPENPAWRG
jgi:hypothetical protein